MRSRSGSGYDIESGLPMDSEDNCCFIAQVIVVLVLVLAIFGVLLWFFLPRDKPEVVEATEPTVITTTEPIRRPEPTPAPVRELPPRPQVVIYDDDSGPERPEGNYADGIAYWITEKWCRNWQKITMAVFGLIFVHWFFFTESRAQHLVNMEKKKIPVNLQCRGKNALSSNPRIRGSVPNIVRPKNSARGFFDNWTCYQEGTNVQVSGVTKQGESILAYPAATSKPQDGSECRFLDDNGKVWYTQKSPRFSEWKNGDVDVCKKRPVDSTIPWNDAVTTWEQEKYTKRWWQW